MGHHQNELHDARKDAISAAQHPSWRSNALRYGGPPRTFREAKTKEEEPVIPAPHIFQSLLKPSDSKGDADTVPTVGECAAHLGLLEAFYTLKAKVLGSEELDSILGIIPRPKTVYRTTYGTYYRSRREVKAVKIKDTTFAARRKEKWPFFVQLAVVRFRTWLEKADLALKEPSPECSLDAATRVLSSVLPPLGTFPSSQMKAIADIFRCAHGLALISPEPSGLSRVLQGTWLGEDLPRSIPVDQYCELLNSLTLSQAMFLHPSLLVGYFLSSCVIRLILR